MPRYRIAHINEQGQDIIIVPLDSSFDNKTQDDQFAIAEELQAHAAGASLRGTVVPVWISGGRFKFIAPQLWHPFFQRMTMQWVMAQLNRELYW